MGLSRSASRCWVRSGLVVLGWPIVLLLGFTPRALAAEKASPPSEYLILLDHPDPEFASLLRAAGAEPVRRSGARWLARMAHTQCTDVQSLAGVRQVVRAVGVVLEVGPETTDLSPRVEALGGMVVQKYENMSAWSVYVPVEKLLEVQQLPGVKRIRKQRTFVAFER